MDEYWFQYDSYPQSSSQHKVSKQMEYAENFENENHYLEQQQYDFQNVQDDEISEAIASGIQSKSSIQYANDITSRVQKENNKKDNNETGSQVKNLAKNQVNNLINNQIKNDQLNQKIINPKEKNKNAQYGKNASKQLGNYLRKHIIKRKLTHIPQLANFVNKKQRRIQSNYTLKDWRDMLMDNNEHQKKCKEFVFDYLKNWAYLDTVQEYKQGDPTEMIEHIQHFMSGCLNPAKLICNRRN